MPPAGQLVEQLLIQRLIRILRSHRHENVAANELVHHLAIRRLTREYYVLVLELDHHALDLPIHVPGLE